MFIPKASHPCRDAAFRFISLALQVWERDRTQRIEIGFAKIEGALH